MYHTVPVGLINVHVSMDLKEFMMNVIQVSSKDETGLRCQPLTSDSGPGNPWPESEVHGAKSMLDSFFLMNQFLEMVRRLLQ